VALRWREERETVDGWLGDRVRRRILPSEVWDVTAALREAFAEPPDRGDYRSIAFESGALLEKYLGWTPLLDEPGPRTIPVRRCLILAQGVPPVQIDQMVQPWSWLLPAAGHFSVLRLESQRQRRRKHHNDTSTSSALTVFKSC
jgi:hypothetical protein